MLLFLSVSIRGGSASQGAQAFPSCFTSSCDILETPAGQVRLTVCEYFQQSIVVEARTVQIMIVWIWS